MTKGQNESGGLFSKKRHKMIEGGSNPKRDIMIHLQNEKNEKIINNLYKSIMVGNTCGVTTYT